MDPRAAAAHDGPASDDGGDGRTILFSSHILEEVERPRDGILVIHSGRLAAAGDYRAIRQLMTTAPHVPRALVRRSASAAAFMAEPAVFGTELRDDR
jgi:ABC-2 type transport system ATP-binding protein